MSLSGLLHSHGDRLQNLLLGQGRGFCKVLRAEANLSRKNLRAAHLRVDAHVHDADGIAEGPCHGGHPRDASGHIDRLGERHGLGRRGYSLRDDAVVRRKNQNPAAFHLVVNAARKPRQADGDFLQTSEASGRFGQRRLPLCRSIHRRRIRGRNFRNILQ